MSGFKKWVGRGMVVVTTLLVLFLGGEFLLRWKRPDLMISNQLHSIMDPMMGWRFAPCQINEGWTEDGERRKVKINSLGFPDIDHDVISRAGVQRMVFLGDSFTAAVSLDSERSFVSVTRQKLEQDFPGKYEVMNFGIPSFGTANEYLAWKYYASCFHPRDVVLVFFLGNDVANQLPDYPLTGMTSPRFELRGDELIQVPVHIEVDEAEAVLKKKGWFYYHFLRPSLLYQEYKLLMRDFRDVLKTKRGISRGTADDDKRPFWKRSCVPVDWQTYLSKPEPDFEEAWRVTEALILRLKKEIQSSGANFWIVLLPGLESMDPEGFKKALDKYPGIEKYQFDLEYPRRRMLGFLRENTIPSVDIAAALREHSRSNPQEFYFKFDRHLNSHGHRIVGERIYSRFKEEIQRN